MENESVYDINFRRDKKKIIKQTLKLFKENLGEQNTAVLLAALHASCDYAMGEKGLAEVREIKITFNNLHTTKCNLKNGFRLSHE